MQIFKTDSVAFPLPRGLCKQLVVTLTVSLPVVILISPEEKISDIGLWGGKWCHPGGLTRYYGYLGSFPKCEFTSRSSSIHTAGDPITETRWTYLLL